MTSRRRSRLEVLEARVRRLQPDRQDDIRVAVLEAIIPAEMAALFLTHHVVYGQRMTHSHAGPSGPYKGPRPKTDDELRTDALRYQDHRRRLGLMLKELRELTGDDDALWRARGKRLQAQCNALTALVTGPRADAREGA